MAPQKRRYDDQVMLAPELAPPTLFRAVGPPLAALSLFQTSPPEPITAAPVYVVPVANWTSMVGVWPSSLGDMKAIVTASSARTKARPFRGRAPRRAGGA